MTAATYSLKGEAAVHELWRHALSAEQNIKYVDGLTKVGISSDEPPAVKAAKYHYFTNIIGGLEMEYIEESDRKVWIRYRTPMWAYSGVALIAMPERLRRTIFSVWHPRDGILMGTKRLAFVATKFSLEGDPYDECYWEEVDRDLSPEEMMRYEVAVRTPEFDPDRAPRLDTELWPETRILKARHKFSEGYVRATVDGLYTMFGALTTHHIVETAMRKLAIQITPELATLAGVTDRSVAGVARLHQRLLVATRRSTEVQWKDSNTAVLRVTDRRPFDMSYPSDLTRALFEFHRAATQMLNGHLSIEQRIEADGSETWTLTDTGRWLW
ncbi:hypothetical protein [Nocardia sp. CA-119907]|uniref:hypothetical protein n=1 Tax=Nocardia sp. CA-119907 TaxID=3239973 RepID=UPI003D99E370